MGVVVIRPGRALAPGVGGLLGRASQLRGARQGLIASEAPVDIGRRVPADARANNAHNLRGSPPSGG